MHSPIRTVINYHYIKYFTRLKKCGPRPQSTVGLRVKKWKAGGEGGRRRREEMNAFAVALLLLAICDLARRRKIIS